MHSLATSYHDGNQSCSFDSWDKLSSENGVLAEILAIFSLQELENALQLSF